MEDRNYTNDVPRRQFQPFLLGYPEVATVAENTYSVCEYLDQFDLDAALEFNEPREHLVYHGCHQKARGKNYHAVGIIRRAGYAVDPLDSTRCGMAGSFGYEVEYYSMSMAIGEILYDQHPDSEGGDCVVTPNMSCRTQIGDDPGAAHHPSPPIEAVTESLDRASSE